jgi:hypothetical protein
VTYLLVALGAVVLVVLVLVFLLVVLLVGHVVLAPVLDVVRGDLLALHAALGELLHHLEELLPVVLQQVVRDREDVPGCGAC